MTDNTINNDVTMGGATGTLLAGRYRVIKQLGQGGMGSVWLAEDVKLDGHKVAIKMLPSILVSNMRAYNQLKSEALVALKLTHPNIATVRAFEENNGNPFLVMDYIDGLTLDEYLAEKGKLDEESTYCILEPVARALDYAHERGIVHRDVKPGNVMVTWDGDPYVLDFGIAREIQETMTRVTGKLSSGTLMYMSPEQLKGASPKPAQDVYSFAAMAYECLKGEPPFSRGQVEWQIVNQEPEPLASWGMAASVMRGLAKDPAQRPATCRGVLVASRPRPSIVPVREPETEKPAEAQRAKAPRGADAGASAGKTRIVAVLLAALAVVGAGGWWWNWAQRKAETARMAEIVRQDEERRLAEEKRAAEEAKRAAEEARLGEEKRQAEAAKRAAEEAASRLAEEKRKAESAKRAAEEAAARLAEEKRQAEAAKRAAEEAAARLAEEKRQAEAAKRAERRLGQKPGDVKTITLPGGATMEMVWCPPGSFMMGSPSSEEKRDSDETQHKVTLTQGFWMGKYEVTQRQWESVMGGNPSRFKGADRPVEDVSWDDCQAFIKKINAAGRETVSLPTEAQWEYACRAGTTTPYNFGSSLNGDKANCNGNYPCGTNVKGKCRQETAPVGSYAPNAWGIYDMHGNVWEWCADWYGDYPTGSISDPTGPASGTSRVYRGGSWSDGALCCRSAVRYWGEPGYRNYLGFRLVCSPRIAPASGSSDSVLGGYSGPRR